MNLLHVFSSYEVAIRSYSRKKGHACVIKKKRARNGQKGTVMNYGFEGFNREYGILFLKQDSKRRK